MRQDTLDSVQAYLRLLARLGPGGVPALEIKALIAEDPLFGHHAAGLAAECNKSSLVSLLQLETEPRAATLGFRRLQLAVRVGDGFSIEPRDALVRISFGDGAAAKTTPRNGWPGPATVARAAATRDSSASAATALCASWRAVGWAWSTRQSTRRCSARSRSS